MGDSGMRGWALSLRIDDDEHILLKVHDYNEAFAQLAAQLWAAVLICFSLCNFNTTFTILQTNRYSIIIYLFTPRLRQ